MIKGIKLLAVFIIFNLLLGACGMNFNSFGFKPSSMKMELSEHEGPPIYRQGYKDGCESGYSAYGNNFNKMFYTWKQDPKLTENPVYYQIWKDAYAYCANYGNMLDLHGLGNFR